MTEQETKWQISPPIPEDISEALSDYSPTFRQILYNREITTSQQAEEFLTAQPPDYSSLELLGTQKAVERISRAIKNEEKIAIYGDYDADGVTATALMLQTLTAIGANVRTYIPYRFTEGYGLNKTALEALKQDGVDLVVTVDCGIRAVKEALSLIHI